MITSFVILFVLYILLGDLNSRVRVQADYIPLDDRRVALDTDECFPDDTLSRASRDKLCNVLLYIF